MANIMWGTQRQTWWKGIVTGILGERWVRNAKGPINDRSWRCNAQWVTFPLEFNGEYGRLVVKHNPKADHNMKLEYVEKWRIPGYEERQKTFQEILREY